MPLRPVLRPGHDVVRRDASTLLVGPPPSLPLPDEPGLVEVLRLLDGHTLDEVVSRARTTTYAGDVHRLVERLVGAGVVGDAAPAPRPEARLVRIIWGTVRKTAVLGTVQKLMSWATRGGSGGQRLPEVQKLVEK